jgi:hypothetical protein
MIIFLTSAYFVLKLINFLIDMHSLLIQLSSLDFRIMRYGKEFAAVTNCRPNNQPEPSDLNQ